MAFGAQRFHICLLVILEPIKRTMAKLAPGLLRRLSRTKVRCRSGLAQICTVSATKSTWSPQILFFRFEQPPTEAAGTGTNYCKI